MDTVELIAKVNSEPYACAVFYMRKIHPFWGIDLTVENEWEIEPFDFSFGYCPCCGSYDSQIEKISETQFISARSPIEALKEISGKGIAEGRIRPRGSKGIWADFDKVLSGEIS